MNKMKFLVGLAFGLLVLANGWTQQISHVGGQKVITCDAAHFPPHVRAKWEVLGLGRTEEKAREDALEKAALVVADYLQQQPTHFDWTPTRDYIARHLVSGEPHHLPEKDRKLKFGAEEATVLFVAVPITITDRDYARFVQEDLNLRSQGRLLLLAKGAAFVLAGLVLLLGYLKLEERTRGYLSRYLGMGLLGLLIALGVALLMS